MKWDLITDEPSKRVYQNQVGSQVETNIIYTDIFGKQWWGFKDLFKIPMIRIAFSKNIADLFTAGVSREDLSTWIAKEKEILRSQDPEKYEKLYRLILEKEDLIKSVADPLKQHLSLCTIYVLNEDERIDYYDTSVAAKKMEEWQKDLDAVAFFLSWHLSHTTNSMDSLKNIFQTVSRD